MDTSRLLSLTTAFVRELEAVSPKMTALREALKKGFLDQLSDLRHEVEQRLAEGPSNHFPPSWLKILEQIGTKRLVAPELHRRLTYILDNEDLRLPQKAMLIGSIQSEINTFTGELRHLESGLASVRIQLESAPRGYCEVGALYPSKCFTDLEDFAGELKQLDKHLRALAELSGEPGSLHVRRLETASLEIFLTAGTATGVTLATLFWGLMRAWREFEEIKKIRAETRKIDAEVSDMLDKKLKEKVAEARALIAKDVMANGAVGDKSRRNELSIAVEQAITFFENRVEKGALFEVTVGAEGTSPEREQPTLGSEKELLIRERGGAMSQMQLFAEPPLLTGESDTQ